MVKMSISKIISKKYVTYNVFKSYSSTYRYLLLALRPTYFREDVGGKYMAVSISNLQLPLPVSDLIYCLLFMALYWTRLS